MKVNMEIRPVSVTKATPKVDICKEMGRKGDEQALELDSS